MKPNFYWYRQTRLFFSILFGLPTHPTCRFIPTCSQYTQGCLKRYGIVRGLIMSLKRVARCHPLTPGGFDPVI